MKRSANLCVNGFFKKRWVGNLTGFTGGDFLVLRQSLLGLVRLVEAKQNLAEVVVRGSVLRFKFDHLKELFLGVFEVADLLMGATELKTYGVDCPVDVFGLLQSLEGLDGVSEPKKSAAADVKSGARTVIELESLLSMFEGFLWLIGAQKGVGEIEVSVRVLGPEFGGLPERLDCFVTLSEIVIILADVGQTSEFVGRGRLPSLATEKEHGGDQQQHQELGSAHLS